MAGNRTSTTSNGTTRTYTTPASNNRLASWGTGTGMTYDAAGCVTSLNRANKADISVLGWDSEYQLTGATVNGVSVGYTYDVLGRRTSRTMGSSTEYYIYDGLDLVADLNGSGTVLRTYTYGPGVDNILAMTVHNANGTKTNYYYLKDLSNTVLALVNSAGVVVESYDYDAYGNVTIKDGDGNGNIITASAYNNRFLFQGREYDYTTELYNFRARWYDPETGRWLSTDPIGISGGLNLYAFCGNNPVCFVDPMGNFSFIPAIVGAVIGGIVGGVTEALEGGDLGDIVKGAAIGAISGGASGLTLGLGNFITVGAVSGAVGSAVSDALNQAVAINSGEQCEYDGLETFYDGIIGGFGGLIGGGISNCLTPRFLNKCVVSSWADDGPADLLPGRWVMIGDATWDNKILSGRIFYSNSVSCEVNSSTLSLPPSWEVVKSALGQFRLK